MHPTQAISSVLSSQALYTVIIQKTHSYLLWVSSINATLSAGGSGQRRCRSSAPPLRQRPSLTSLMQFPSSFRSCTGSCILISSFRNRPFTSSPRHFHGHRSPPPPPTPTSVQPSLLSSSGSSRAEQLLRFCTEPPIENVDLVSNSLEIKQSVKKQLS